MKEVDGPSSGVVWPFSLGGEKPLTYRQKMEKAVNLPTEVWIQECHQGSATRGGLEGALAPRRTVKNYFFGDFSHL